MNAYLAALEIPGLHFTTVSARQQEVARAVKRVAENSCLDALEAEALLTNRKR